MHTKITGFGTFLLEVCHFDPTKHVGQTRVGMIADR